MESRSKPSEIMYKLYITLTPVPLYVLQHVRVCEKVFRKEFITTYDTMATKMDNSNADVTQFDKNPLRA